MEDLRSFLIAYISADLQKLMISSPRKKEGPFKIHIRPVEIKEQICYQAEIFEGTKVFHRNCEKDELVEEILRWMESDFRQMQVEADGLFASVLVSKKGKVTIKKKEMKSREGQKSRDLSHNRTKRYILPEGQPVGFLMDLGIMKPDGGIAARRYDKFRQINRYLEFVEDVLPAFEQGKEITIIDFGCGKSYLTFALYYYLHEMKGDDVKIIGLDLKEDVIRTCNELSEKYGFTNLKFYQGDIASFSHEQDVDMVVSLHACDTATDFALEKAVKWGAKVIFAVPCCQHELNGQIHNEKLDAVFRYGIIKERMAALLTDAMRASLLEKQGYDAQILEFIDMEHTPKNLLIRAVKNGKKMGNTIEQSMDFFHAEPMLEKLLGSDRSLDK